MEVERVRAHVHVSGRVQGVYFRATTQEVAREHAVDGWVQNLTDGRVEAAFEGQRTAVEAMLEFCHEGSPAAEVTDVSVEWEEPHGLSGFEVRH